MIFFLQNNNRGGYNAGDRDADAAGNNAAKQYQMVCINIIIMMSPLTNTFTLLFQTLFLDLDFSLINILVS